MSWQNSKRLFLERKVESSNLKLVLSHYEVVPTAARHQWWPTTATSLQSPVSPLIQAQWCRDGPC